MIFYWNQTNFEGLKGIGELYSSKPIYKGFSDYCLFREMGLKKKAFTSLNEFLSTCQSLSDEEQRKVADEISSLGFWNGGIHQLVPHPLQAYLQQVLESWVENDRNNPVPCRWLGHIRGDIKYYEKAIEVDPNDEVSVSQVAIYHINEVDYQTHHLNESRLIGNVVDAKASLEKSIELINTLVPGELKDKMEDEYKYYRELICSWEEYKELEPEVAFIEWCSTKGREFNFSKTVYYEK